MDIDCHGSSMDSRLLLTAGRPIQLDAPFAHRQGHHKDTSGVCQRGLFAHRHEYLVNLLASMGFSPTDTDTSSASMSNLLASVGYSPIDTNTSSTYSHTTRHTEPIRPVLTCRRRFILPHRQKYHIRRRTTNMEKQYKIRPFDNQI